MDGYFFIAPRIGVSEILRGVIDRMLFAYSLIVPVMQISRIKYIAD